MKLHIKQSMLTILIGLFLFFGSNLFCKENTRDIISKAMKDELSRNLSNLKMEGLKSPFYISYSIYDAKELVINAELGSITKSEFSPDRGHKVRVMTGDYHRNNENFMDMSFDMDQSETSGLSRASDDLPLEDDYNGIRRALWIATDNEYKSEAVVYEKKLSAMKQQTLSQEDSLDDFSKAPVVKKILPPVEIDFNKSKWEASAKELSAVFNKYSQIYQSSVSIKFSSLNYYFLNSEGSEVIYPVTIAAVQVNASTQADDGAPLSDYVTYYALTPDDLPSIQDMTADIKEMADNLTALRKAPVVSEPYSGPVLFEGDAVAELFIQKLFSSKEGISAKRKQIVSDPSTMMFMGQMMGSSLEGKMGTKIISSDITVKAEPSLKKFGNVNLIGSYAVDAEAVEPPDDLTLIDKGKLVNVLNDRVPTPKCLKSNGDVRVSFSGFGFNNSVGAGVITVNADKNQSEEQLKTDLMDKAKENGLEFAYIVKKFKSFASGATEKMEMPDISSLMSGGGDKAGMISAPVKIYRVSVKDGKEELVRSAKISVSLNSMKNIAGISDKKFVYNTMTKGTSSGGGLSFVMEFAGGSSSSGLVGIPASFILPTGVLFPEIEVNKDERAMTMKPPVVPSPVGK